MPSGKKAKRQRQQRRQPVKQPAEKHRSSLPVAKQPAISPRNTLTALALIIAAGLLVYANTFNAPFVLDDSPHILENPFIRVTGLSIDEFKKVMQSPFANRRFASLTFAVNYYFHQYDVTGYHIVNITIHLVTAFLVFFITRQTLRLCRRENDWMAISAALLWLVNPVHIQSVTYIVQRMNSLAAMFYLLAMVCYIQGRLSLRTGSGSFLRPKLLFAACALAGLSGLLSKEIAATLPVMIFLYEWYFFQNLDKGWLKKQLPWIIGLCIALTVIVLTRFKGNLPAILVSGYADASFTLPQRLLTEPGVMLYYLSLLFFPSPDRLRLFYQLTPATSLFSPAATLLSFAALTGLIAAVPLLRHRNRLLSFAIVWFLVNLVIESSFIPLALAFEHRTYLPSVFPFIALTCLLFTRTTVPKASAVVLAAVILSGVWTWQRNSAWTDSAVFWRDAVMKTPGDPRAHYLLGLAHEERGELETAITRFKAALDQDDTYEKAYNSIGMALIDLNRPAEAIPFLEKAIALKPDPKEAYYNLGQALNNLGRTKEAEACYARVLEMNPLYEKAHNNIGLIMMNRGRSDEAIAHFKRALAINPDYEKPYNNMGIACFSKGETDQALAYFKKALALKPDYAEAAGNLDNAARTLERYGPTIAGLRQALLRQPDELEIIVQLATICRQAGMADLAIDLYEQALSLDPECEKCLKALTAGRQ